MEVKSGHKENHDLIVKYVFGETNADETTKAVNLLYTEPELKTYYYRIRKMYDSPFGNSYNGQIEDVKKQAKNDAASAKAVLKRSLIAFTAVAAAAVVAMLVMFKQVDTAVQLRQIASGDAVVVDTLPDGSSVNLNKNSGIRYNCRDYKHRMVYVDTGEVFFKVMPDPSRPFVVMTATCKITVLGTSFNVKAFEKDSVEVTVVSGRVNVQSLRPGAKSVSLQKGDQMLVSVDHEHISVYGVKNLNCIAWKTGVLDFNEVRMGDVLITLEDAYGITIDVEDTDFIDCLFTAKFKNQPIDAILEIIEMSFGAEIIKNNNRYTVIQSSACL